MKFVDHADVYLWDCLLGIDKHIQIKLSFRFHSVRSIRTSIEDWEVSVNSLIIDKLKFYDFKKQIR
jgi:hypothetical protein